MSYRCGICKGTSPPGQDRLVHVIKRPDQSIEREIPVCSHCHKMLTSGRSVKSLLPGKQVVTPPPSAVPLKRKS